MSRVVVAIFASLGLAACVDDDCQDPSELKPKSGRFEVSSESLDSDFGFVKLGAKEVTVTSYGNKLTFMYSVSGETYVETWTYND